MAGRRVFAGLFAVIGVGCSVGEFNDSSTFGGSNVGPIESEGSSTSGGGPMTTGVSANPTSQGTGDSDPDPSDTSGVEPGSSSTTDDDSAGSTTDDGESSGGSAPMCGDGVREGDEACDGADLGEMSCADVGEFVGGRLSCDAACAFDTSACMEMPAEPVSMCQTINLGIPDNAGAVSSVVSLPAGGTIADATVSVALTHTFIGDLTVDVVHEGTTVRVYDRECSTEDDMDLVFDDAGAALDCGSSTSGASTIPSQALSAFDGAAAGGDWTFSFQDNASLDTGTATEICVTVSF